MRRERDWYVQRIRDARAAHIYNVGTSGRHGAEAILEMIEMAAVADATEEARIDPGQKVTTG